MIVGRIIKIMRDRMEEHMIPDRLKIGDNIGIISPSTPITEDKEQALDKGRKLLEEIGIKIGRAHV